MTISRKPIDISPVEHFRYDLERIVSSETLDRIYIESEESYNLDKVVIRAIRNVACWRASETLVVSWPADWWQHFKQRFFPSWALKRWPVLRHTEVYRATAYLPSIPVPDPRVREQAFYGWKKELP